MERGEHRPTPERHMAGRYRPAPGETQVTRTFSRKVDATRWLAEQTAALVDGRHVHPTTAKVPVAEWCDRSIAGYGTRRPATVRQAGVHIAQIKAAFGRKPLAALRPSDVRRWTATLKADGSADSYVYALHNRLSQLMSDAVHDGLLTRSPCSRRTSPPAGVHALTSPPLSRCSRCTTPSATTSVRRSSSAPSPA